jgi:hypothetical protein
MSLIHRKGEIALCNDDRLIDRVFVTLRKMLFSTMSDLLLVKIMKFAQNVTSFRQQMSSSFVNKVAELTNRFRRDYHH